MAKQKSTNKFSFKKNYRHLVNFLRKNRLPILLSIILLILTFFTYQIFVAERFYPLTFSGETNISFLNPNQAIQKIDNQIINRAEGRLDFTFGQKSLNLNLTNTIKDIDYSNLEEAFIKTHYGTILEQLIMQFQNLINAKNIKPKINLNLENQFNEIASQVDKEPKNAEITFNEQPLESTASSQVQIKEDKLGLQLDRDKFKQEINNYLLGEVTSLEIPTKTIPPKVTTEHVLRAKEALDISLKQSLKLSHKGNIYVLDTKQLLTLLDLTKGEDILDKDKTYIYIDTIVKEIDQEVQEGLFEFNPKSGRVSAFRPSREGRKLDTDRTYQLLTATLLSQTNRNIDLPVTLVKPKIQTEDVNNLGIKELIGRGISNFAGSIPNRIYNVNLTAQKINGVLLSPGEVFSFNKTVSDITAATGFKQAYVIKGGRTVLDDGGGVCQDSTTLFRAVLNAGLPVVKRTAHAYRVGYYEQGFPPGLDATVFYPSVDFQFKNDTTSHILIQAYTAGTTLYVDLYGTSDGREVSLSKPTVTDRVPAPPELRQDDPTLPKGTVKQVDWAAQGAKVKFTRTVIKNGEEIIKETWNSIYKPWQAIYLVGTQ